METLQTLALIGIILSTYIYIIKTVTTNFKKSKGIFSTIIWGIIFYTTLSFLFGSSGNSGNITSNSGYGGGYDEYENNDDCDDDYDGYDDCSLFNCDNDYGDDDSFDDDYDDDDD